MIMTTGISLETVNGCIKYTDIGKTKDYIKCVALGN